MGITKIALKKTIGKLYLTHTQLQTIITEVEAVINSRPLVYVDDDSENQIIMPNHFLSLNTKMEPQNLYGITKTTTKMILIIKTKN